MRGIERIRLSENRANSLRDDPDRQRGSAYHVPIASYAYAHSHGDRDYKRGGNCEGQ